MRKVAYRVVIVGMCVLMAVGCATIIHGTTQDIEVSSSPDNAEVWVDGAKLGSTPTRLTLKRKSSHEIKISKQGYKDVTATLDNNVDAWIIGNVIFGGLIGCGIDFITGGAYDLTPERLDINLTQSTALNGQKINVYQLGSTGPKEIDFIGENGQLIYRVEVAWVN